MVLLFLFSKVAIFKVASFFFFLAFFQKLFALGGVLLTYMMKNQAQATAPAPMGQPISMYGLPSDYNTVGYSYGPPDHEPVLNEGPSIANLGGAFNWLSGKQWIMLLLEYVNCTRMLLVVAEFWGPFLYEYCQKLHVNFCDFLVFNFRPRKSHSFHTN